jgi:uncharacterized protein (TIGR00730 family)
MTIKSLCVYCGSSHGARPEYSEIARAFGRHLAGKNIAVVYGGGHIGLMGAVADGALEAGGEVFGVIPGALEEKELSHEGLTELHVVPSMHDRKLKMAELSDAFVALPGGIGTLEEFFEAFTWTQLGIHPKPCALLNIRGFYDPLQGFLQQLVKERFLRQEHLDCLLVEEDGEELVRRLESYEHVVENKWLDGVAEAGTGIEP